MNCKDGNTHVYVQNYCSQNSILVQPIETKHYIESNECCHSIYVDIIDNRFIHTASSLLYKKIYESYDASINDQIIFAFPEDNDIVLNLPPADNNGGKRIVLKRRTGDKSLIVRAPSIDGVPSIELFYLNESVTFVSDGNIWCII